MLSITQNNSAPSQPQRSQQTPHSYPELICNSSTSTWGGEKAPRCGTTPRSSLNSQLPPGSGLGKGGSGKTNRLKAHGREMMQRKCLRQRSIGSAQPGAVPRIRAADPPGRFLGCVGRGILRAGKEQIPGMRFCGSGAATRQNEGKWAAPTETRGSDSIEKNWREIKIHTEYLEGEIK